jgi:hypothetical protein
MTPFILVSKKNKMSRNQFNQGGEWFTKLKLQNLAENIKDQTKQKDGVFV